MNRDQALSYLRDYVKSDNLLNHMLGVEAIMRGLAKRLGQDEEKWALTGLLHDIDYEMTENNPQEHSVIGAKILEEKGLEPDIVYAIKAHNEIHGLPRNTMLDKALYAADPTAGLIAAVAYVMPSKKLEEVQLKSLKKKFKDKAFAKGANREQIKSCEELGLTVDQFLEISLQEMKKIADQIGL
uniref:HDIG domain-containing metalloprotein n=1 Tax=Caldanaerobius polysaccharolyticus TaxID=44256 RepID=UPI00047CD6FB